MTDSRDELRSALEGLQAKDDEAASGQRGLGDEREAFERNEAATIVRLQSDLAQWAQAHFPLAGRRMLALWPQQGPG